MKTIEYYYNIIYYFFYRWAVNFFKSDKKPSEDKLWQWINSRKIVQKQHKKFHIDNPEEHFDKLDEQYTIGPDHSLATMYGGGITIASLAFIFVGLYHILKIIFFPTYEDSLKYIFAVTGILAYLIDNLLVTQQDQGIKYIKEFNAIKDKKWRLKWAIITALVFPFSIWFMISTSTDGMIGKFLMKLHHTESANSILYRPDESAKNIDDLIIIKDR